MKIILATGGFDPLHSGHIAYLTAAKQLGDKLVVGLNSDEWLARKKGRPFMPLNERFAVVSALGVVDQVLVYNDDDGSSCDAIRLTRICYPDADIVFVNGGDRTAANVPEMIFDDVQFVFGVGGSHKANSSSWILQEWKAPRTERAWGYYRVLHQVPGMKVKELTVNPGAALSMQRHQHRSEYWIVEHGQCCVNSMVPNGYLLPGQELKTHDEISIPCNEWHQLINPYDQPCRVVEIQYGACCDEEDIERK